MVGVGVYSFTPSFAITAASTYRRGIARDDQPPASCRAKGSVLFLAAVVAQ